MVCRRRCLSLLSAWQVRVALYGGGDTNSMDMGHTPNPTLLFDESVCERGNSVIQLCNINFIMDTNRTPLIHHWHPRVRG